MAEITMSDSDDGETTMPIGVTEEMEGVEEDPAVEDLKKAIRKCAGKLRIARCRSAAVGRVSAASKVFDKYEDGSWLRFPRGFRFKKPPRTMQSDDEDDEFGSGAVMVDGTLAEMASRVGGMNGTVNWQMANQQEINTTTPMEISDSNMGVLSRVPPEIRNRILYYAVVEEDGPFVIVCEPDTCSRGACTHEKPSKTLPGILSTCKQIRHEALPVFCAENTFEFDTRAVQYRCPATFLRALGDYSSLIKNVILDIKVREPCEFLGVIYEYFYKIKINLDGDFTVRVDGGIRRRERSAVDQVLEHADQLAERYFDGEAMEKLLLEFVWSDSLADLVYNCEDFE